MSLAARARCAIAAGALALAAPRTAGAVERETWPLADAVQVGTLRCARGDELVATIATWLGRDAVDRRLAIVVEDAGEGAVRFVVRRDGEPVAERRFRAARVACADLRAAVGLAIALAIDATVLDAIEGEEAAPAPGTPAPEAPAGPRAEAPPAARRWLEVDALVVGVAGVLPRPGLGGGLGVGVPLAPSWVLRAGAWAAVAATAEVGTGSADVAMVAGEAATCIERPLGLPRVRACGGFAAGRWSARGRGFGVNHAAALPWVAATGGLELRVPLADGLGLSTRLDGYVPVVRPVLEERDERGTPLAATEPPPAGVRASVGVTVAFP